MINARPGYWDIASCSWVGGEPMYVVPPALRSEDEPAPTTDLPAQPDVPGPRHRRGEATEATPAP